MSEIVYSEAFPAEPGIELERSVVSIPIHIGLDNMPAEVLKLDALMKLRRAAPIQNSVAIRQFVFQIDQWELYGFSTLLNSNVTFTLSETPQPASICMANQHNRDFPATIMYSAIYDVFLGKERVVQRQPGIAVAQGITSVPPRGVMIAFQKQFERDGLRFEAGACGAMSGISDEFYERELAKARAMRS
jgi:hypothetical protein